MFIILSVPFLYQEVWRENYVVHKLGNYIIMNISTLHREQYMANFSLVPAVNG